LPPCAGPTKHKEIKIQLKNFLVGGSETYNLFIFANPSLGTSSSLMPFPQHDQVQLINAFFVV
jgi:hypothetical protein